MINNMALDSNDKLTDISTVLNESTSPYYTDMYNAWQTKEQLRTWFEVSPIKEVAWEIDTALSYTTLWNTYTLSVPSFTWNKIFSLWIDWNTKTFQPYSYASLETDLQTWLWANYVVDYVSWTDFTIVRNDWRIITKTAPNLVRKVDLSSFDTISVIDLIIDWQTITLDWATHWWSAYTAFVYVIKNLTWWNYYRVIEWNSLIIARIDWAIPVITKTQYNKYDYTVAWYATPSYNHNASSWNVWWQSAISIKTDLYTATIWWTAFTYTVPVTKDYNEHDWAYTYNNFTPTAYDHHNYDAYSDYFVDYLYSQLSSYTRTSIVKQPDSWICVNQVSFTFNNWSRTAITVAKEEQYIRVNGYPSITTDTVTRTYLTANYNVRQPSNGFSITENTHTADMAVTTYTEITITFTNTWTILYYIPCTVKNIKKITMTAVSSGWSSEWTRVYLDQSCITKYSTTTTFVADKIFKTDATNYWNIVSTWIWYFIISRTTDKSNKLNYVCS